MAIIGYSGLPGAGKSYSVVENVIIPALKERRHVVHNLMLNIPALSLVCDPGDGKPFDAASYLHELPNAKQGDGTFDATVADQVIERSRPGAVVVLDEVWQYWPAGLKVNETPVHHLDYFKKHRHRVDEETGHATEIVLIDQCLSSVPAWLRSLVDLTYLHEKLDKVGAKGRFRVQVYSRAQPSEKPRKSAHVRTLLGKYKPEVWNCYQSHTENKRPDEAGLEKAPDGRGNVWKSWPVRAAIVGAIVVPFAVWQAFSSFQSMLGGGGLKGGAKPAAAAQPPGLTLTNLEAPTARRVYVAPELRDAPESPPPAPETAPVDLLQPSQTWRLLGVVSAAGDKRVILTSATGRRWTYGSDCEPFEADWRCKVEDGYAYAWSGGGARALSGATTEGLGQGGTPLPRPDPVRPPSDIAQR